jgi:deoxyinosine 3'endonuclease (endonuclease V)
VSLRQQSIPQAIEKIRLVAGVDVSYEFHADLFYADVVVLRMPDLCIIEKKNAVQKVTFPYYHGLLSFREAPNACSCFLLLPSACSSPRLAHLIFQTYNPFE